MSERRSTPRQLPNVGQLREMEAQGNRSNRANEPVTTRNNVAPLQWVRRPAGQNGAGEQLYTLHIRNPITGDEALVAGPI